MTNFDPMTLIDLDECVLNALQLFIDKGVPELQLGSYQRPLVLGSGNAAATGRIIMEDHDAVFADESTYQKKLEAVKDIDGAILISASGAKHAPLIAEDLKKRNIEVRLLTNNKDAPAKEFIDDDKFFVFPKNPEPYTYNTSTYMGPIIGTTKEDPQAILDFIKEKIDPIIPDNFKNFDAFFLIVPTKFDGVREMFLTKFDELFGPKVSGRVFTPEHIKHAKTVIPSEKEFFISFGYDNQHFGLKENRLHIPLPDNANYAAIMAIGYYVIGKVQKQHAPYFKENIVEFLNMMSSLWGQKMDPLV